MRRRRAIVVVIENPDEDPDVFAVGDVDLILESSYPASKWVTQWDRVDYKDYPAHLRAQAARVRARAPAAMANYAADHLEELADAVERRNEEAGL